MSGGHWDYVGVRVRDALEMIGTDPIAREKWPYTAAIFDALAGPIYEAEHDMDWDLSSDSSLDGDSDKRMAASVLNAVLRAAPDEWFPRGKWATVQAVQGRQERVEEQADGQ